jgi:hypothetical protein
MMMALPRELARARSKAEYVNVTAVVCTGEKCAN